MADLRPTEDGDEWIEIVPDALPVADALAWAIVPSCGGVVTFAGTVRDHAEGRSDVTGLEYEAYHEAAVDRLREVAAAARRRWSGLGRIALLHRVGRLGLGETAVVVVVSAPHRQEAFDAARWCIDTLKETVPIWKKEEWDGGSDWGTGAVPIQDPSAPSPAATHLRSA